MSTFDHDIIVIGAGAGGLVVAVGAVKAGKKVLIINEGPWGGDCTNFGCIPSKSLIAASEIAHHIKTADQYGIQCTANIDDTKGVLERIRKIIAQIRSTEDPTALQALGIDTIEGAAQFIDQHNVQVNDQSFSAKEIVIATGSHPFAPPIEGLSDIPYLTNETVFDLEEIPKTLTILGGGPIGCELGQAFSRLGCQVTIVEAAHQVLAREEPEAQELVTELFKKEGITLKLEMHPTSASMENGQIRIACEQTSFLSDQVLVATGRVPACDTLSLEKVGVAYTRRGIQINAYGQTSISHIWAVGDVTDGPRFTHMAENQARTVLLNLILPKFLKRKMSRQPFPRCTYVDPEVASFGMSEKAAIERYGKSKIAVYKTSFEEIDRAITTGQTLGFIKIVSKKWTGQILGATICGPRAGEMLSELTLASQQKIPLRSISSLIHPYPTYSLGIRKTADQWWTKTIIKLFKK